MKRVTIQRQFNIAAVVPDDPDDFLWVKSVLEGCLRYERRFRVDAKMRRITGKRYDSETVMLCKEDCAVGYCGMLFPAGLTSRAVGALTANGGCVTKQDLRTQPILPPPALDRLDFARLKDRPDQKACLAAIFTNDMGLIEAPTAFGKTFLIGQVVRAYPTVPIIVSSYRQDVVKSIYHRLQRSGDVPFGELGLMSGHRRDPRRVTVSTVDSLDRLNLSQCRLFIYDEAHEAAAERRSARISQVHSAHIFGLSATVAGRSDGSDLVTEAMFGPLIYRLSYQDAAEEGHVASIEVVIYPVFGRKVPTDDDVQQYRHGIWRNALRNGHIAAAASESYAAGRQTLIIVDKVEHALYLKRYHLEDWPIVHGSVDPEQISAFKGLDLLPHGTSWLCTAEQRDRYRRDFEHGALRRAIATNVWSTGVDFTHLDTLIRGDAQSGAIPSTQIPGRLARGVSGTLVDFDDKFDDRFARRSQRRFKTYRSKGWTLVYRSLSSITGSAV